MVQVRQWPQEQKDFLRYHLFNHRQSICFVAEQFNSQFRRRPVRASSLTSSYGKQNIPKAPIAEGSHPHTYPWLPVIYNIIPPLPPPPPPSRTGPFSTEEKYFYRYHLFNLHEADDLVVRQFNAQFIRNLTYPDLQHQMHIQGSPPTPLPNMGNFRDWLWLPKNYNRIPLDTRRYPSRAAARR